jgi:hypothetical protein
MFQGAENEPVGGFEIGPCSTSFFTAGAARASPAGLITHAGQ